MAVIDINFQADFFMAHEFNYLSVVLSQRALTAFDF